MIARRLRRWARLVVVLGLTACRHESMTSPAGGDVLRLADQDDIPTLDPALGYDTASWQFEEMLFSTLVGYDDDGRLQPEVATQWEVSPDGRTYTFTLREDVRFSNGRPVTAADFRFAIARVLRPGTRSPGAEFFRGIDGAAACNDAACELAGVDTSTPGTLRIRLTAFDPLFLHKLAMPFAAAVPAEEVARWGDDFARHPVGSGPFVLREWYTGQRLELAPNPHYWEAGVPRLGGIVQQVGVNEQLEWLKYEAGEVDVTGIPPAEFPRVMADPAYRDLVRRETTLRTNYLGMNCRRPPFDDRRVRQAMNHAVDKDKLLRLINRRGVEARGVLPPRMPGYDPALRGYAFDPARARALLAEAGYPEGFTTTLWVRVDDTTLRLAQSVQQDLAEIGVTLQIKSLAWGPFLEAVRANRDVPMFLLGWEADFPDPSNFLDVLFHSHSIGTNNNTGYANPELDALVDAAARTVDQQERFALLRRAEQVVVADAPWVFLFHPSSFRLLNARVRDYRMHPFRPERLDRVWLADGVVSATR